MLDRTPTTVTAEEEPAVVLILNRSSIRRWVALGILTLVTAVCVPSPATMLPKHNPICQDTNLC